MAAEAEANGVEFEVGSDDAAAPAGTAVADATTGGLVIE